jgi:hypothetical protein
MGDDPKSYFGKGNVNRNSIMTKMIFSKKNGVIETIASCPPEIQLFVKEGDAVREFTNSRDYIGQTICTGSCIQECEHRLSEWESQINMILKAN